MELGDDMVSSELGVTTVEPDVRDDRAARAGRRWMVGAIVAFDLLAIVAFVTYVVIPRVT